MEPMPQEQSMDPTAMDPTAGEMPDDMNSTPMDPTAMNPNASADMEMADDNMKMDDEGIDAEGDDKKKEIQKLAGKLSELLHTYNEENGDDEELNKYVKGMIDAQTDGDTDDEDFDMDDEDVDMEDDIDIDDEDMEGDEDMEMPVEKPEKKMKESKTFTKRQLKEEFGEIIKHKNDKELRLNNKINKNKVNPKNPFIPPKFN